MTDAKLIDGKAAAAALRGRIAVDVDGKYIRAFTRVENRRCFPVAQSGPDRARTHYNSNAILESAAHRSAR